MIGCSSFLMFHLHLLCDIVGSKGPDGYQWPIPYLSPLYREINLSVPWQWELNAWQNILIAIIFFVITYKLIKIKGESLLNCSASTRIAGSDTVIMKPMRKPIKIKNHNLRFLVI